jgi:hypothetical protein
MNGGMIGEERIGKEAVFAYSRLPPDILVVGLRNTMKISGVNWNLGQGSNTASLEYKCRGLSLH